MGKRMRAAKAGLVCMAVAGATLVFGACRDSTQKSVAEARAHVAELTKLVEDDVAEVRSGLPRGARLLGKLWTDAPRLEDDPKELELALMSAREKVQDLRVAKSTFFALARPDGVVLRNDRDQDLMAGKPLFGAYPELRGALSKYVETSGSLREAAGMVGRADAQWVAAHPVVAGAETRGLYVTGWSWSSYAYRLENALRGSIRSSVGERGKMPLVYVFVVSGKAAYAAPAAPDVNVDAVAKQDALSRILGDAVFATSLEITGRSFGLAVRRTPALGRDVGVAVLRSET